MIKSLQRNSNNFLIIFLYYLDYENKKLNDNYFLIFKIITLMRKNFIKDVIMNKTEIEYKKYLQKNKEVRFSLLDEFGQFTFEYNCEISYKKKMLGYE